MSCIDSGRGQYRLLKQLEGGRSRRRGLTILEILVALTVLAAGVLPLFNIMRNSRRRVDVSRDQVLLQAWTLQLLQDGRSLVAMGRLWPEPGSEEPVLSERRGGCLIRVGARLVGPSGPLLLVARGEGEGRFFEASRVVAAPYSSRFASPAIASKGGLR